MSLHASLSREFQHEAATTRRHLERLTDDKLGWRPHVKSFTAGDLAAHIVECVGWTQSIFTADHFDFDPATFKPFRASSMADLIAGFDERVAAGASALAGAADADLFVPWRLVIKGRTRFEKPKMSVFRDFTLSHLIHHRGQLTVYLRLLDIPVPGSYGPTADEKG